MISRLVLAYWQRFVANRNLPGETQVLHERNVYIIPSAFGWLFALLLITLFTGAVNYQLSTAFLMTFMLAMLAFLSAIEANNNLKGIRIHCQPLADTAQGEQVQIQLWLVADQPSRYGLYLYFEGQAGIHLDQIPPEGCSVQMRLTAVKRGLFTLPRLIIQSRYPFGFFTVWGYARLTQSCYIYPQAIAPGYWPQPRSLSEQDQPMADGDEEYYELVEVKNPWQAVNRIAWKIAARNQGWFLKNMRSPQSDSYYFSLQDLNQFETELALQYLSWWVQQAEIQGDSYGLALQDNLIPPGHGELHLRTCLRALAIYS